MIYKLINPSDGVLFEGDDDKIAFVACFLLSQGHYGMEDIADGRVVCPLLVFGGRAAFERDCEAAGVHPIKEYFAAHKKEVAAFLRTAFYGREVEDLKAFKAVVEHMSAEERRSALLKHNEAKRSSLSNIGAVCAELADELEASA